MTDSGVQKKRKKKKKTESLRPKNKQKLSGVLNGANIAALPSCDVMTSCDGGDCDAYVNESRDSVIRGKSKKMATDEV